jgi:hypothetical protein
MAQWGASNLPVNVTAITTVETSNGAPISAAVNGRWGRDNAAIVVTEPNSHFGNTSPGSRALADLDFFQNSTPGAYIKDMGVGIYGISSNQTSNSYMGAHAGWTLVKLGTGGRAGRVLTETLVAMHSLADPSISDLTVNSGDALLSPDSNTLVVGA